VDAEAQIRQRFSDSIIDHVNVWLNVHDNDLNIIYWNKVAEEISGYSREQVLGHTKVWEWLYPDEDYRKHSQSQAYGIVRQNKNLTHYERDILCANGERRTILWNSRSLKDEQGNIYGAITFGYDITDRKRAEEALKKAHDELAVLYDVASVASESIDLDTILTSSLDRVLPTMRATKGTIHLWNERTKTLDLAAYRGLSSSAVAQLNYVSPGSNVIGQVFEQGAPLAVSNMGDVLDLRNPPNVHLFHTYLGAPMRAKGKVLGVISVLGKARHQFSSEQISLLTSIAHQIGVAVENARLYQEAGQLAVMEERRRLARDLHDSVTQSLFSLTLFAEAGQRLLRSGHTEEAEEHLTWLSQTARDALKEMRLLVYELRPLVLEETGGLVMAIQRRLDAVERRAGIKAQIIADGPLKLPLYVEENLYRVIQEALNNSLKHASADSVTVLSHVDGASIQVVIEDNGVGFDWETVRDKGGMGLLNMRERTEKIGGEIEICSQAGLGTRVEIRVPCERLSRQGDQP
jgi:PAS domain S-box-containing protein